MRDLGAWRGVLAGRRPWRGSHVHIVAPNQQSTSGGSGSFLALGSDGKRYWVKVLNGPQGNRVPITEQIVAHAGGLIGAPVCETEVVYLPHAIAGWACRPGHPIERGFAHGSVAVENCIEERSGLGYRNQDENAVRHVGYYALYDWCWGDDVQALIALTADRRFYSHDHGLFLRPGAATWDAANLDPRVGEAHELTADGGGMDFVEIARVATRLESITRAELAQALARVPRSWPVTDDELENVGAFLEERAPQVAGRLRARFGGGP